MRPSKLIYRYGTLTSCTPLQVLLINVDDPFTYEDSECLIQVPESSMMGNSARSRTKPRLRTSKSTRIQTFSFNSTISSPINVMHEEVLKTLVRLFRFNEALASVSHLESHWQ